MSESNIFLSMRENLSKGFNSINAALGGFSKKVEEIQKAAKKQSAELQQAKK